MSFLPEVINGSLRESKPIKIHPIFSKKEYPIKKRKIRKTKAQKRRERKEKQNHAPKNYKKYIVSKYWTFRKTKYYATHPRKCAACESTKTVQLHHMVYGRFGDEPDDWLVALCQLCHEEYHELYGTAGLKENTNRFIIEKQQQEAFKVWF